MGFFGMTQSLAKEGESRNIKVNCIAPLAGTRMTKSVIPEVLYEALKPEMVAPLVALLAHEECPDSGVMYEVGGGFVSRVRWERSQGHLFKPTEITPEAILAKHEHLSDFEKNISYPTSNQDMIEIISENFGSGQTADSVLKAEDVFGMMHTYLAQGLGKDVVPKV